MASQVLAVQGKTREKVVLPVVIQVNPNDTDVVLHVPIPSLALAPVPGRLDGVSISVSIRPIVRVALRPDLHPMMKGNQIPNINVDIGTNTEIGVGVLGGTGNTEERKRRYLYFIARLQS